MKPGGILDVRALFVCLIEYVLTFSHQIIEEDLIFPAGPTPSPSPPVDSESQSLRTSGGSTSSTTSNYPSSSSNRSRPSHSGMPPAPSGVASTSRAQSTPRRTSHAVGSQASAHTPLPLTMDSTSPPDFRPDPRDHSRLRESWEALISRRFLASKLTSILHLHLTGTFARVHVHPLIQIPLPPNSAQAKPGEGRSVDAELTDDEGFGEEQSAADSRAFLSVSSSQRAAAQQTPGFYEGLTLADLSWIEGSGPMHLACVVKTIEGCQEALWQEYQELFAREPRCGDNTPREDFEMYWDNWLK